ncbi:hypothetical protein [Sphingobacterium sp. IITKGP-BTPF85]|uniref:AbiTii domain-containing protein n=1 Tax=Sphingobacterium sp. IITKGP-BTPF85 TaxID=1338009 RepID=UPI000389E548|nr:hypothetical protein [Sphingobacterium sp. IITKGP-BTPF85]KKX48751.1 hypothetical protein L950_0219425 [Sphingobacterium sp. IITKGP-BTPF85]
MKLLESIINDLVSTSTSLNDPLLKTKVLATRIRNAQVLLWVESELSGYKDKDELPGYRRSKGILKGSYLNGYDQYSNVDIPIAHLDIKMIKSLTAICSLDSVSSIEELIGKKGVKISVNAYQKYYVENSIREIGNPYFQISSIYLEIPATFLNNIVSNVRSKLLEFMLQLEQEFGVEADILILANNNNVINQIMNTTINNSGDGAIINNGDNNKVEANINITKGNKEALKDFLLAEKLPSTDVDDLLKIVDKTTPVSKENFGEPVNSWMHKMLGKVLDGSWQIGIGAAGNVLAQALQSYYNIK